MPIKIVIPRLGWSMDEGTFGEWLKRPGDQVKAGDMLFVLEGEKASQEVESFDGGTLFVPENGPREGDTVAVGQVIGYLLAEGERPPQGDASGSSSSAVHARQTLGRAASTPVAGPATRRLARELGVDLASMKMRDSTDRVEPDDLRSAAPPLSARSGRVRITPRARRAAQRLGVSDWTAVPGTGRNGRIRERDILAWRRPSNEEVGERVDAPAMAPGRIHPASKIRFAIARRMALAARQAAPVTLTTRIDATALCDFRRQLKSDAAETAPTYNDILIKCAAAALVEFPELNACWVEEGAFLYDQVNIALAMESAEGLLAPVITDVPALTLDEVAEQSRTLAAEARGGSIAEHRLHGGTFTVTNLGVYDVDYFTPILNLPQAAILGVGRIVREPVVKGDQVVPGDVLRLSLTFDHRIVDGAPAARWLQRLGSLLQQPEQVRQRG